MSKRSLKSAFFVAVSALALSPHNGKAAEPGACHDKSQIDNIMLKENQVEIISAIQSPQVVNDRLVGNVMNVTFTSDATGKTGYILTEDGCIPLATEGSTTEAAPVGVKVSALLRDIHLYEKTNGVPPEARMDANSDVAIRECDTILANLARQGRHSVCDVHNKVLESQLKDGLHVIFQAKGTSKANTTSSSIITVSSDPYDGSGVVMWTTPRGAMFLAGIYSSIPSVKMPKNTP